MLKTSVSRLCFILLMIFSISSFGQQRKIEIGATNIAINQYLRITMKVENERLKEYTPFPDIEGFVKRGTSSSSSTSFVNGQMTSSQSIIQSYQPTREGTFNIGKFSMTINGEKVEVAPFTVKVGPAAQQQRQTVDPFDPFGRRNQQPTEFIDVDAEAFLALTTDKKDVFVGEGFTVTIAFYVAETNRADMRFFDLSNQIANIVKEIKPEACWEENFNIDNINGEPVKINGKGYTQYKVYQAAYYPLNIEDISFPSVGLKLIKYQVAKNPSFFGRNRKEDYETFYSKPKSIEVKELPPHPLRDQVAVGQYRLAERISGLQLKTGESFDYNFNILGEGNISAIEGPKLDENDKFDFYAPNVKQDISRSAGRVKGTKSFSYYGIPNEPGQYELGDYFQWVFFNPDKEAYDTLRSKQILSVSGQSRKNEYIMSNDMGSFYDGIEFKENTLYDLEESSWMRIFANAFILAMIALSVFIFIRK
ncbi:MAG: BatD family protein [Cyclobacteriaceae bacterium]